MIVFDLECRTGGHRFEGWFGSSADFASQHERGLVSCPQCGATDVVKAPMAPAVPRKGNQLPDRKEKAVAKPSPAAAMPPEAVKMMQALALMQAEALKKSRWVGDSFAEDARAIHYGERDPEPIHGQATIEEAKALIEEGVEIAPLPFPVAPPEGLN